LSSKEGLIVDVVAMGRRPGTRRDVVAGVVIGEAIVGEIEVVDSTADVDVVVESINQGISATGTGRARWAGPCRRCLARVEGELETDFREVFELEPTEGETWPITDERIDLTPAVREAVVLALPVAPLCKDSCRGPEPDRFPTGVPEPEQSCGDPRWAALDGLSFDEP